VPDYNTISLYRKNSQTPIKTWDHPTGGRDLKPDSAFEALNQLLIALDPVNQRIIILQII
jgi:hypothetical protein